MEITFLLLITGTTDIVSPGKVGRGLKAAAAPAAPWEVKSRDGNKDTAQWKSGENPFAVMKHCPPAGGALWQLSGDNSCRTHQVPD